MNNCIRKLNQNILNIEYEHSSRLRHIRVTAAHGRGRGVPHLHQDHRDQPPEARGGHPLLGRVPLQTLRQDILQQKQTRQSRVANMQRKKENDGIQVNLIDLLSR